MISCDAATPLLEEEIPENRIEEMLKRVCLQIVGGILYIISVFHRGGSENVMQLNYLSFRTIHAAINVHREQGPGLLEKA